MTVATQLLSLLQTAAGTMTKPECTQVGGGEPDNVTLPTLAYWFTGVKTWEANTFTYTQELSCWHIRLYLPVAARWTNGNVTADGWLADFVDAVRGELYGAIGLNGAATGQGCTISDFILGWSQMGGQLCRVADMDLEAYLSNVHPIAV